MVTQRHRIGSRLALEQGTLRGHGQRSVALVYPSPYRVGMSSLGFQTIYRLLNSSDDTGAERAFLPDPDIEDAGLLTYESGRPVSDFPVVAFSVAYELEVTGVLTCLARAGIPLLATQRRAGDPWVIMGGPLTFSNPACLGPFADAVVIGEAEGLLQPVLEAVFAAGSRQQVCQRLADHCGVWVPSEHGSTLPALARADDRDLPAYSAIVTPQTELTNMFLVETERGCSRGCTFCVMRRSTNGGMRVVPANRVLETVPDNAMRVGLVGAAVSDHPQIVDIVQALVTSGREVGLSSLRAERLTPELVGLLVEGGYRTLTVASDGASERLRSQLDKKIREEHLLRAAELAAEHGIKRLKVYVMVGVPGETDADLDELIAFSLRLADKGGHRCRICLGIAPFVPKRNTPLAGAPFVGIKEADRRIGRLRKGLVPRVEVRPTSSRWAWVEHQLARGGPPAGLCTLRAWRAGGSFSAFRKVFQSDVSKGASGGGTTLCCPARQAQSPCALVYE